MNNFSIVFLMKSGKDKSDINGTSSLDRTKKGNSEGMTTSRHKYKAFLAARDVSPENRQSSRARNGKKYSNRVLKNLFDNRMPGGRFFPGILP